MISNEAVSIQLYGEKHVTKNEMAVIKGSIEYRSGSNITFLWSLWVGTIFAYVLRIIFPYFLVLYLEHCHYDRFEIKSLTVAFFIILRMT